MAPPSEGMRVAPGPSRWPVCRAATHTYGTATACPPSRPLTPGQGHGLPPPERCSAASAQRRPFWNQCWAEWRACTPATVTHTDASSPPRVCRHRPNAHLPPGFATTSRADPAAVSCPGRWSAPGTLTSQRAPPRARWGHLRFYSKKGSPPSHRHKQERPGYLIQGTRFYH